LTDSIEVIATVLTHQQDINAAYIPTTGQNAKSPADARALRLETIRDVVPGGSSDMSAKITLTSERHCITREERAATLRRGMRN
jgi:hypothetical protein